MVESKGLELASRLLVQESCPRTAVSLVPTQNMHVWGELSIHGLLTSLKGSGSLHCRISSCNSHEESSDHAPQLG